jgi:hypothetical protein
MIINFEAGGPICLQIMFMKSDLDLLSIDDSVEVTSRPRTSHRIDVVISTLFAMTLSGFDRNVIIENKWENTCINKFVMENELFGSNTNTLKNKV